MSLDPRPTTADARDEALVAGTSRRQWRLLGVLTSLVVALLAGLLLGRAGQSSSAKIDDPVDVGFARDMIVHHSQAVEMSAIIHRRSPDPTINYLSFDILTTQQGQIGMMSGWLRLWDQTQTDASRAAMAWMGEPHDGPMPGMATREEIDALEVLPLPKMHEQYLRLMIRHHRAALPMAAHAAAHATSTDLAQLAMNMSDGQASEIDLMQDHLVARGFTREPDSTTPSHDQHPSASTASAPPATSGTTGHGSHSR